MRSESVKLALYDIRDNILLATEFEGLASQEFGESRLHIYAVTRALEIISEASRRLPVCAIDIRYYLGGRSGMLAISTGINTTTLPRPMSGKP